ncbi:shikimate dehydrogenase [Extensimonas sp. H3M7-6]|uniref:shikimate dehydrogenase n=1 Tax=Extensimonas soli TaxID=3031322 RepID=UPI0023DB7AE0|nr:shikimate dehydrogenase [Extensimonas sp. H3M7-6]MDF1481915.1 shikimate dehydrogenase [Extensimonas sp. H3M7-6]
MTFAATEAPAPPSAAPDLYAVMGHPVAHSRSPAIHRRFAELTGQHIAYEACLLPLDGFAQGVRDFIARGGRGCNVTVPFKHEAAQIATQRSARVALAGAANTLLFTADGGIYADNTDGLGLVADITRNAGVALAGRDVLLVGAGGAAAGVLGPLLAAGVRHLTVANRTLARAQALVQAHTDLASLLKVELTAHTPQALEADFDVIINATASSLAGAEVPVPARVLRPGSLAYDMMYGPAAHGFLHWAQQYGARPRDGLGMLVEQAAESFALWRGVRPPSAQVLAELQAQLQAESHAASPAAAPVQASAPLPAAGAKA